MQLIDSHCHLDLEDFDQDRPGVIERAALAGVVQMITIGIDISTSVQAVRISEQNPSVFAAVGFHPHEAARFSSRDLDELRQLAGSSARIVGLGEIGLDYYRNISPVKAQNEAFAELIQLGIELDLPLIIHDRDAHEEVYRHLADAGAGRIGGVIHCFSGDYALARRFLDLGFHISVTGAVTFPKADELRDVAARVPLDRLLVETDAPYLAPLPYRGKRNEPAFVAHTAAAVARVRNMDVEELAAAATANTRRLFRLPEPVQP